MMGRAGRPGFDTNGIAVIMTSNEEKAYYEKISLNAETVESTLAQVLTEAITAEISQSVITSIDDALIWLKSTFFYIRARSKPALYGFPMLRDSIQFDGLLHELCRKTITDLADAMLVKFDEDSHTVEPYPEAHIMTRHMIKFGTMKVLMELFDQNDIASLLLALSKCTELQKPLRRDEKSTLNALMKALRFPLKAKVQSTDSKVYVLLQAAVGRLNIIDFSLRVEQSEMVDVVLRILAALQNLCIERLLGPLQGKHTLSPFR